MLVISERVDLDQGNFLPVYLAGQVNLPKKNLIQPAKNGVSGEATS